MRVTSRPALLRSPPTTHPMAPAPMIPILVAMSYPLSLAFHRVRVDAVLLELLAQRIAVDPEDLRGAHLVALGLAHDGAEQRLLDQAHHEPVQVGGRMAAEIAHAFVHLLLYDVLEGGVRRHGDRRRHRP